MRYCEKDLVKPLILEHILSGEGMPLRRDPLYRSETRGAFSISRSSLRLMALAKSS
jgi:hypothetical protein